MNDQSVNRGERRKIAWPVALALGIVFCSSQPVWEPNVVPNNDKIIHFFVFGLLATLVARITMVRRTRPIGIYAAILIVSAFGATDEFHQYFTPGRSSDFFDWVADTAGAAVATVVYAKWRWYRALLETGVWTLIAKRRVEIDARACVIAGDGSSGSPDENRGTALTDRAA